MRLVSVIVNEEQRDTVRICAGFGSACGVPLTKRSCLKTLKLKQLTATEVHGLYRPQDIPPFSHAPPIEFG